MVKWVNFLLPWMDSQFTKGLSTTRRCPSRCTCFETQSHFLRCPHHSRKQLYIDLNRSLRQIFNENNIDPDIRMFYFIITMPQHPTVLTCASVASSLIKNQISLGLDSIFYGFFHVSILETQQKYLLNKKLPSKRNQAFQGVKHIARCITEFVHSLWLLRNTHLHGKSSFSQSFNHSQLLLEVKILYDKSPLMLAQDRDIFHVRYQDRADYHSTAQLKYFIKFATPIINRSIRDANQQKSKKATLHVYFPLKDTNQANSGRNQPLIDQE